MKNAAGFRRTRKVQDVPFAASSVVPVRLPGDACILSIFIRLSGSCTYTFSAGSPAAPRESTFDTLCRSLQVMADGSKPIKMVRPHLLKMEEILYATQESERKSSAGASAATNNNPTADGGFAWGTTGQTTTVAETVRLCMTNPLMLIGGDSSALDCRRYQNVELKFDFRALSELNTASVTALVFTANTFSFEVSIEEDVGAPESKYALEYRQTYQEEVLSAQVTDKPFSLARGNLLLGFSVYVKDGSSPSVPSNNAMTALGLRVNGEVVHTVGFQTAQAKMRQAFRGYAPFASNVSRLDGFAYVDLTQGRDIRKGFDLSGSNVRSADLILTSGSSATYTYSLTVGYHVHELVKAG